MKPDISVIVPVYNVENYLSCCINSLLTQSYENIEIICVNDGSTDSSLEILKDFQRKDERIVIISKENAGYGDTINCGLREARGTYVGIVESDDFAEPDMYEKLYKCAEQYHADIVKANFNDYFTASGEKRFHEYLVGQQYDTLIEQDKSLILLGPVIWAGLYRKSFLQNNNIWLLDTAGASYQDTSFSFKVFLCAQRVVFLKDAVINYRNDRDDSSVNSNEKVFCICNEVEECKRFMTQRMADLSMIPLFVRNKFYRYKWNLDRLHGTNKIKFFEYMHHDFLKDEIQGYFERKYWNMEDWVFAHRLIYDFQNLFEDLKKSNTSEQLMFDRDKVTELSILQSIEGVYIYGAGKRADKIYDYLCKNNVNVMAYVISDGQLLKKSDKKIPTLYISDVKYPMNELFIIGVSERYKDEIINELSKRHINSFININHLLKE